MDGEDSGQPPSPPPGHRRLTTNCDICRSRLQYPPDQYPFLGPICDRIVMESSSSSSDDTSDDEDIRPAQIVDLGGCREGYLLQENGEFTRMPLSELTAEHTVFIYRDAVIIKRNAHGNYESDLFQEPPRKYWKGESKGMVYRVAND